jgi:phage tail-like protein
MADDAEPESPAPPRDPYRDYRFRLKWDGRHVAGVSKVSALTRGTQVISHRAGGDPAPPHRVPGQAEYEAITLERGVTHDPAFVQWANKVWDYHSLSIEDQQRAESTEAISFADFRKDVVLEVYDEARQLVMAYTIHSCWPSEFTAMQDTAGNAVLIMTLKLENEGWEHDPAAQRPDDPGFAGRGE